MSRCIRSGPGSPLLGNAAALRALDLEMHPFWSNLQYLMHVNVVAGVEGLKGGTES